MNLGAGVILANLRLDHQFVTIGVREKKIQTSLKKLGSILGEGTQIGCSSVLNPGTLIGPDSFCYPCLAISGVFQTKSKIDKETLGKESFYEYSP